MIGSILLAACTSPTNSFTCLFGAGSNVWFPIVLLASLAIITVAGFVYQLSPLLGRTDIRVWARAKIYDSMITILFALIFLSFSTLILTTNPISSLTKVGLVPNVCNPSVPAPSTNPSPSNIADIYGLSACDVYTFNQAASAFTESLFVLGLIGGINPTASPLIDQPGYPINTATGAGVGFSFNFQAFPIVLVHQYMVPYMQVYFTAIMVSNLLQIVLDSSMLFFSVFMILGLLARSFSITKSYGGAMIAFGLGLGFVFPLVACLTYGFLNVAIQNTGCILSGVSTSAIPTAATAACKYSVPNIGGSIFTGLLSVPISWLTHLSISWQSTFAPFISVLTPLVVFGGFIGAGLMLIPLLNIVLVDAFIVDFSRSIGERMDLFSLFTRIL